MTETLITIRSARERVLEEVVTLPAEPVELSDALGRVLAQDVTAAADVPAFPCSAMDGYAIAAGPAGRTLTVIGESRAGTPATCALAADQAIRISTGAAVPAGAEAVVRQEDVAVQHGTIQVLAATPEGGNVRPPGDDVCAGSTVLRRGMTLGPVELGAAVAAGAGRLVTVSRPQVSVLCTGDELRAPGESLGPGQIHNSNAPMLSALATRCGAVAAEAVRLADDPAQTAAGLAQALGHSDVVVVSGGISVGPHDHVKPALASLGVREVFAGVALQPGKPTWFGVADGRLVFGLPGNPVSAVVAFALFVGPALRAMQGASPDLSEPREAILGCSLRRHPRREQAIRVTLRRGHAGLVAIPNGQQGSHNVTSLVGADALALIPPGEGELDAGAPVSLWRLIE